MTTYTLRKARRLLRHGAPAFRHWQAANPDMTGAPALLAWLQGEGVPVVGLGPVRVGIRGEYVEEWYPTPEWMRAAMGDGTA